MLKMWNLIRISITTDGDIVLHEPGMSPVSGYDPDTIAEAVREWARIALHNLAGEPRPRAAAGDKKEGMIRQPLEYECVVCGDNDGYPRELCVYCEREFDDIVAQLFDGRQTSPIGTCDWPECINAEGPSLGAWRFCQRHFERIVEETKARFDDENDPGELQ